MLEETRTVTASNLENPPEWLTSAVNYLKCHGKHTKITPQALAQKWESRIGKNKKLRLRIAGNLLRREVLSFKDLTQGEINALCEVCEWIPKRSDPDEGDAKRRVVRR